MDKDPEGRAFSSKEAACIGELCYSGIDRMAWFDLDEEFYKGTLPSAIQQLRQSLVASNDDFTGMKICKDLEMCKSLLEFSNLVEPQNEFIVVRSPMLTDVKGAIEIDEDSYIWLGYDCVSLGNWSLLREGLFRSPGSFAEWATIVNEHGLLPSPTLVDDYVRLYAGAAATDQVEEVPVSPYGISPVEIGRPKPT